MGYIVEPFKETMLKGVEEPFYSELLSFHIANEKLQQSIKQDRFEEVIEWIKKGVPISYHSLSKQTQDKMPTHHEESIKDTEHYAKRFLEDYCEKQTSKRLEKIISTIIECHPPISHTVFLYYFANSQNINACEENFKLLLDNKKLNPHVYPMISGLLLNSNNDIFDRIFDFYKKTHILNHKTMEPLIYNFNFKNNGYNEKSFIKYYNEYFKRFESEMFPLSSYHEIEKYTGEIFTQEQFTHDLFYQICHWRIKFLQKNPKVFNFIAKEYENFIGIKPAFIETSLLKHDWESSKRSIDMQLIDIFLKKEKKNKEGVVYTFDMVSNGSAIRYKNIKKSALERLEKEIKEVIEKENIEDCYHQFKKIGIPKEYYQKIIEAVEKKEHLEKLLPLNSENIKKQKV